MTTETIRSRIETRLARQGRQASDLARDEGVSQQLVSAWLASAEQGTISEPTLERIARALHASPAQLRYGGEPTLDFWEGAFRAVSRMQLKLGELSGELAAERAQPLRMVAEAATTPYAAPPDGRALASSQAAGPPQAGKQPRPGRPSAVKRRPKAGGE